MLRRFTFGFTLMELMAVLAIVAILLAVAIPAYNGLQDRARLKSAAQSLVGDLDYLRTDALRRDPGSRVSLVFTRSSASQWCYGITGGDDCDCLVTDPNDPVACSLEVNGVKRLRVVSSSDYRERVGINEPTFPANASGRPATHFSAVRGLARSGEVEFTASERAIRVELTALGRILLCSPSELGYPECD